MLYNFPNFSFSFEEFFFILYLSKKKTTAQGKHGEAQGPHCSSETLTNKQA